MVHSDNRSGTRAQESLTTSDILLGEQFLSCLAFSGCYRLLNLHEAPEFESWVKSEFDKGLRSAETLRFINCTETTLDISRHGWEHLRESRKISFSEWLPEAIHSDDSLN